MLVNAWDNFWFTSRDATSVSRVRIAVGLLAAVYFACWLPDIQQWFGNRGILATTQIAQLLELGDAEQPRWLRISPLFMVQSEMFLYGYLLTAIVGSLLMTAGMLGRYSVALVLLCLLGIIHRGPMLQGLAEPILTVGLLYLVIDPGKLNQLLRPGLVDRPSEPTATATATAGASRVTANIALRLLQLHGFAFLALAVLSELAGMGWWSGQSVWWLAAENRTPLLSPAWLGENPLIVNLITHTIVLLQGISLILLWPKPTRRLGIYFAIAAAAALILGSDQLLYPMLVVSLIIAFYDPKG